MKVLLVTDMQNDFIDGALGTKEAESILPNVKEKINEYYKASNPVIFTRDTHNDNYLKTLEGKNLPVPHCILGTKGHEICSKLPVNTSLVIDKPSFGYIELSERLKDFDNLQKIDLIGLCTDICVISNAMKMCQINVVNL